MEVYENDDYQPSDDTVEELTLCDECGEPYIPNWDLHSCDACMATYWHNNPHPLDIAEREFQEDQSAGLEEPWWRNP